MRVAVDARPLHHPATGIGRYTERVLTLIADHSDCEWLLYGAPRGHALVSNAESFRRCGRNSLLGSSFAAIAQMGFWARSDRADLFFSPRHHLPLALAGMPAVTTVHDLVWIHAPESMPTANLLLERTRMPPSMRRSKRIIVPSLHTQNDIRRAYPALAERTRVAYLGGDLTASTTSNAEPIANTKPLALFIGGGQARKNLIKLLEAMGLLRKADGLSINLSIVGELGAQSKPLTALVDSLGLNTHVRLEGNLDESALAKAYQQCTFLIAPSLYEGFGLPVAEALQFSKPSIVSQDSALSEIAGNTALTIDPANAADIANAITRLTTDSDLYRRLSKAAGDRAELFRWNVTAQQTAAILNEAVAQTSE